MVCTHEEAGSTRKGMGCCPLSKVPTRVQNLTYHMTTPLPCGGISRSRGEKVEHEEMELPSKNSLKGKKEVGLLLCITIVVVIMQESPILPHPLLCGPQQVLITHRDTQRRDMSSLTPAHRDMSSLCTWASHHAPSTK